MENGNLFVVRFEKPAHDIVHTVRQLGQYAGQYINQLELKTSFMQSQISRNSMALFNGTKDMIEELTLIGAGSLGSQVLDGFVRSGSSKVINLVDHDVFYSHNLARHTLDAKNLMRYKVDALKDKYQGIDKLDIRVFREDFLHCKKETCDRFLLGSHLVIDASTSVGVERKLALDCPDYIARKCTLFLSPKGKDIVVMMEDENRSHRLDFLEMDYYRNIIIDDTLLDHLEHSVGHQTEVYSCRSESVVMNFNHVVALGAVATNQIKKMALSDKAVLSMWRLNEDSGEITRYDLSVSEWIEIKDGKNTAYICKTVYDEMCKLRSAKLEKEEPEETGGTFMGTYDRDRHIIYIVYMIPAPADSVSSGTSYIRGVDGLDKEVAKIKELTDHQMLYVGEWHSHPHGCSNALSSIDRELYTEMTALMGKDDFPFVLGILADEGLRMTIEM